MSFYPHRSISWNSQVVEIERDLEWLGVLAETQYTETILWSSHVTIWPQSEAELLGLAIERGYISETEAIEMARTNDGMVDFEADEFDSSVEMDAQCAKQLQAFWAFLPASVRLKLVAFTPRFDPTQFAHDYALTRNGHGTGFWDRDPAIYGGKEIQDYLTEWSRTMGETNLYLNADLQVEIDA